MPTITDWIMVVITAIYVVATIAIFIANMRSATASNKQLQESVRQYEETKKTNILPYFQMELFEGLVDYHMTIPHISKKVGDQICNVQVKLRNIGLGTAKDITCKWTGFSTNQYPFPFPVHTLLSGEERTIKISFINNSGRQVSPISSMDLFFRDLLGNNYSQRIEFQFTRNRDGFELEKVNTFAPSPLERNGNG